MAHLGMHHWPAIDHLPDPMRAKKVAEERRILRDDKILLDANGQRVVWYPPNANDQVRERYQEMTNTNFMAEITAVLTNWGVVTIL